MQICLFSSIASTMLTNRDVTPVWLVITPTHRPSSSRQADRKKTSSPRTILACGSVPAAGNAHCEAAISAAAIKTALNEDRLGGLWYDARLMRSTKQFAGCGDPEVADVDAILVDVRFDVAAHDRLAHLRCMLPHVRHHLILVFARVRQTAPEGVVDLRGLFGDVRANQNGAERNRKRGLLFPPIA